MGYRKTIVGRVLTTGVITSVLVSAASTGIGSLAAYANSSENEDGKRVVKEEKPDGTPFSVPGNAELLDDVTGDDSKQFITVRTKNNQTFFVVIDRQNSAENVYMLSMIDEDDLSDFLEDGKDKKIINIPEKEKADDTAEKESAGEYSGNKMVEDKDEKKSDSSAGGLLAAIGIILMIVGGYYFLKIRPRKQHSSAKYDEDEEDEYDDDEYEEDEYAEDEGYEGDEEEGDEDADEYEEDDGTDEPDDPQEV